MHFLEYAAAQWHSRWSFKGVIGEGYMEYYRYRGIIEHRLTWLLRNLKRRILNNQQQQARYPGTPDLGIANPCLLYTSPSPRDS